MHRRRQIVEIDAQVVAPASQRRSHRIPGFGKRAIADIGTAGRTAGDHDFGVVAGGLPGPQQLITGLYGLFLRVFVQKHHQRPAGEIRTGVDIALEEEEIANQPISAEGIAKALEGEKPKKLYRVDLKTWPYIAGTPWTGRSSWHNLSIVPSLSGDTPFAVDWVRLTNCTPVYVNLNGLPANTYDIWLETASPVHSILAVQGFTPQSDGSYAWDVQGVQPGTYTYSVRRTGTTTTVQQGQLTIVPTPILNFTRPSPLSGPDYATTYGNPWDMDISDIVRIDCATWSILDGIFRIDTLPPNLIDPACVGESAGESDPRIFLNVPGYGNPNAYRYLSFSHTIDGAWSVIEEGMIVRLFWILNYNGLPCYYISRAISLIDFSGTQVISSALEGEYCFTLSTRRSNPTVYFSTNSLS